MRKRLVHIMLLLGFMSFCSFCDQNRCGRETPGKKIAISHDEPAKSVDVTNFFLFN